jgi:cytochrome c553
VLSTVLAGAAAAAAPPDTIAQRVVACAACHGSEGRATNEGYYPRIAGKPAAYLFNQLRNFRDGRRRNAAMTYLVGLQSDAYLREIASHFAALELPYPPARAGTANANELERGRRLALEGDRASDIPACAACHGAQLTGVLPATPGLLGLPRDYLSAQIGAWKSAARRTVAPDCMAQIARALGPEDVGAVSAWLAAQPVRAHAAAAPAASLKPPLKCGGVDAVVRP